MNIAALERSLESGTLKPVYVIYGPEGFLRGEALRLIKQATEGEETAVSEPEAAHLDSAGLLDDLRTPALFAPKRLLIVDDAQAFITESGEILAGYAARPAPNATLVLLAESLDRRKKSVKALLKKVARVECPLVKSGAIPSWCIARARIHGKRLEPAAAKLLVDLAGTSLGQLDRHIQGLAVYCNERDAISSRAVADLVGGDHARTVWELVRAITARSAADALRALNRLLREPKVTTPWIIGALARESRDMWQVKDLVEQGHSADEIQTRLGKPAWLIQRIMKNVGGIHRSRLKSNHRLLLQADVDSKTGGSGDAWILEALVLRLCGHKT